MTEDDRSSGLAELLRETSGEHHKAFMASNGEDPEWPLWYSQYLEGKIDRYLDAEPTRSKIVQCLLNADDVHTAEHPEQPWPTFYANYLLGLGADGMENSSRPNPG